MSSSDARRELIAQMDAVVDAAELSAACDHCREQLPLFVTDELANRPVDTLYPDVARHLDLCLSCLYEYEALARLTAAALYGDLDHGE